MTLDCVIDGKALSLTVNSNKPLLQILTEDVDNRTLNSNCHGQGCGGCIVQVDGYAVLSCLVPAFRLKDTHITTFESFGKTKDCKDIERAYQTVGNRPCPNCYESRTLLIDSILRELTGAHHPDKEISMPGGSPVIGLDHQLDEAAIVRELGLITCQCMDTQELLQIIETALSYRRRKHAVRRA